MPAAPKTPAAPKKSAAPKTPAAASAVVVPVAPAPAPSPAPSSAAVAAATPLPASTETRSADAILASVTERVRTLNTEVSGAVRSLLRDVAEAVKAIKREARDSKRRVRKDPATMSAEERATYEARRANNAFLKLRPISDELASFMGLPSKSERSQTDVTKFVASYVKDHSCFDPSFKRRIIPDTKLAKLLRAKDGQEVTYLNLQSFLKVHFLKPAAPASA
jgi:chromatin remodeling complex protein RSC6